MSPPRLLCRTLVCEYTVYTTVNSVQAEGCPPVSTCGVRNRGVRAAGASCGPHLTRLHSICSYLIWEGIVWLTAQLASWSARAASTVSCCPAGVVLEVDVYGVVFNMVVM